MKFRGVILFLLLFAFLAVHRLPAPIKESPTPARQKRDDVNSESKTHADSKNKFTDTWVATFTQVMGDNDSLNATYTIIIKDKKTAIKTMDVTFTLPSDDPLYQSAQKLRAIWTSEATELIVENSSVTIQWAALQLSSWSPKSAPRDVVETRAPPGAGVSVYVLNEEGLTRINPPEGVTYHHVK